MKNLRLLVLAVFVIIPIVVFSRSNQPKRQSSDPIIQTADGHMMLPSLPQEAFLSAKENAIFIPLVDPSIRPGSGITVRLGNKKPRFIVERVVIQEGPWVNLTGEEDNFAASREPMMKVYVKENVAEYR